MGVCYTVEARLNHKNNDPKAFCDVILHEARALNLQHQGRPVEEAYKLNDPFECFKMITTDNAYIKDNAYIGDFNASCMWESVMHNIFAKAASVLDDGSEIFISPDDYWYTLTVKNGEIEYKSQDDKT